MALILDLEKIKKEGLDVDLDRYAREGYQAIVNKDDLYRLKMHGICAQRHEGFFMFRMRVPGGRLDPAKMRRIAELAGSYGSRIVHLTTRQNVELHNLRIEHAPKVIEGLHQVGITPRSSCGHTFRNVMASPCAGTCDAEIVDVRPWAGMVSGMVVARKNEWNERLPKRLNVSFSGCPTCPSPARVNDLGFEAVRREDGQAGFRLWAGGSMGLTARLGLLLCDFLPFGDVVPALKAVTELYITHTDRKNPAKTRLKFLIEAFGLEKFRREFEALLPAMRQPDPVLPHGLVPEPAPAEVFPEAQVLDALPEGVLAQRQKGYYRVPLFVSLGDIHHTHFTTLADWAEVHARGRVLITKEQNLEFQWVPGDQVKGLMDLAAKLGYPCGRAKSVLDIQACPGNSFCSLAVTSSQGAAQSLLAFLGRSQAAEDPALRAIRIHINGCANSCAQHQGADIGFFGGQTKVGEDTRFAWSMFLGGSLEPEVKIGTLTKKAMADEMLVPVVEAVFGVFKEARREGEGFRDFLGRLGTEEVVARLDARLVEHGLSPNTYNRVPVEAGAAPEIIIPGG